MSNYYPKLIGTLLLQGEYGTFKDDLQTRLRHAHGHINAIPDQTMMEESESELAERVIRKLTLEGSYIGDEPTEMIGEPVEKPTVDNRNIRYTHIRFLIRAKSPSFNFRRGLGATRKRYEIPAEWTAEGFVLEVITPVLDVQAVNELLRSIRREIREMFDDINDLIGRYHMELRSLVPKLIQAHKQQIRQKQSFNQSLNFRRYQPPPTPPPALMIPDTKKVFLSYSHEDEAMLNKLNDHLSLLKRENFIETWHDRAIPAGGEIDPAVVKEIESAHIIMLLISSGFMRSEYIWKEEVSRAMERHRAGTAVIIPIILRPVDYETAPFAKNKRLPKDGLPVTEWANPDAAYKDIAVEVRRLVSPRPK